MNESILYLEMEILIAATIISIPFHAVAYQLKRMNDREEKK